MKRITLDILNGYANEKTAWAVLCDISLELSVIHSKGIVHGNVCSKEICLGDDNRWHLSPSSIRGKASSDIWNLGAVIFELLMGVPVFGGRGEKGQTETTPVPTFRRDRYDVSLGNIVGKCLSFDTSVRPKAKTIHSLASEYLTNHQSETLGRIPKEEMQERKINVLKFWPEKMV